MSYNFENIYSLFGKEDKSGTIIFKFDSESYENYGNCITVNFKYTQKERDELDNLIKNENSKTNGFVKVSYLAGNVKENNMKILNSLGINTQDISQILPFYQTKNNTFHSKSLREIKTYGIKVKLQTNGKDFGWIYHFVRDLVNDNIQLTPYEKNFYLGAKLYFEPDEFTKEELVQLYDKDMTLYDEIKYEFLFIKYLRKEITNEEITQFQLLRIKKHNNAIEVLDKFLQSSGSSFKKIYKTNIDKASEMLEKVENFTDKRLSDRRTKAIYLDVNGYLHIYLRHVEEMQINTHYKDKDNFQWKEEDVFNVIKEVIHKVEDEIQEFFIKNRNKRFSKYADESLYYEGDYYTFHIENNGKLSTFHKNKKLITSH